MAATDQTYRNQRVLDLVFGASCLLMLASIVWMFAQDYYREYKVEARDFRDVEEALYQRQALDLVPDQSKMKAIEDAEKELSTAQQQRDEQAEGLMGETLAIRPKKVKAEARAQGIKADYDSKVSLYNIAVEERDAAPAGSKEHDAREAQAQQLQAQIDGVKQQLDAVQAEADSYNQQLDDLKGRLREADDRVARAEDRLKGLTADFDRFAKLSAQKRWKLGDAFRKLPVIDAFASPTRIQQYTLADLPIDYNFKYVTRYDRCTTCHLGIDRKAFSREALQQLTQPPSKEQEAKLANAREMIKKRKEILAKQQIGFDASDLRLQPLSKTELTDARVGEYCAHPRLDLFVDGNSPHPAEKFGCTICHGGQGSATDFALAAHTPDNSTEKKRWTDEEHWEHSHFWDFPMLPKRFLESTCLKCHHQVTDLLPQGNSVEKRGEQKADTPGAKVVRGYNLVRENGCFGCHEIAGIKGGREVGPDLRLEPSPPLEAMTPAERVKMLADPLNPPGTMRKVGPSLKRLVEKTNQGWARKWVRAPRDFRPDTRMPHFFGLTNNVPEVLPEKQKNFPEVEIHSIVTYLFKESHDYLEGKDKYRRSHLARQKELLEKQKGGLLSEVEKKELEEVDRRLEVATVPVKLTERLVDETGAPVQLPPAPKDDKERQDLVKRGRQLFTERGCLACHSHNGTTTPMGQPTGKEGEPDYLPAVMGEANFGPNLSRLAAKIAPENGDADARRRWLVQWIMNPNVHFPRTRMPITHLNAEEAASVAAWLLSQEVKDWSGPEVPDPGVEDLKELARVYLNKAPGLTRQEVDDVLQPAEGNKIKGLPAERASELSWDADERELAGPLSTDQLKWYVGKKTIGRLGCFGCHDIPGFEFAKPTGTPLNDWGKKDPERLAFEDVIAYVKDHYQIVDKPGEGKPKEGEEAKDRKETYERFFFDALAHHQREGFLNQKLREPRSYDYHRDLKERAWDDRLLMPQFRFARSVRKAGESDEDFKARSEQEEAEAREAVMTFILGLVAEPVPLQYVYNPTAERQAEVRGGQVLDKYNCAGCHQLRPGAYEYDTRKGSPILEALEGAFKSARDSDPYKADYRFTDHNAWVGKTPAHPDRLEVFALPAEKDEQLASFALPPARDEQALSLRLVRAVRLVKNPQDVRNPDDADELPPGTYDIPAGQDVSLPKEQMLSRVDPHGGAFVELLAPYLEARKRPNLDDNAKARSGLPPPLLREGEKTQPGWLFQFLRNPYKIRAVTILRMPKFNMSDDEAMALVNYFAAVDKDTNPGVELNYPYLSIPERDAEFLLRKQEEYQHRLAEDGQKDRTYVGDAFRLLTNKDLCLKCHQVGTTPIEGAVGPQLETRTQDRLRPEWTRRWIANPQRLLIYPRGQNPMPQNFESNNPRYKEFFDGLTTKQTAEAQKRVQDAAARLQRVVAARKQYLDAEAKLKESPEEGKDDLDRARQEVGKVAREADLSDNDKNSRQVLEEARLRAERNLEEARKELAQYSLNQVTALRDVLMNFNTVTGPAEAQGARPAAGGAR